ncbi:MAG: hypothetical protein K6G85_02795 [Eubacterium sp.]|nr:hypothetical protein [Eubacterium sp.]
MAKKIIDHNEVLKTENKEVLGKIIEGSTVPLQENGKIKKENKNIFIRAAGTTKWEYLGGIVFELAMLTGTFMGIYAAIDGDDVGLMFSIVCIPVFGFVAIWLLFNILRGIYYEIVVRIFGKKIQGTVLKVEQENSLLTIMVSTPVGQRTFEYKKYKIQKDCRFYSAGCIVTLKVFGNIVLLLKKNGKRKTIENLKDLSFESIPDVIGYNGGASFVHCKVAHVNLWNCFAMSYLGFVLFMATPILIVISVGLLKSIGKIGGKEIFGTLLGVTVFGLILIIEIVCIYKSSAQFYRFISVMIHGKTITGEICGCEEEIGMSYDKKPGVVYIIRIRTSDGYRMIEYKMSSSKMKYTIGETVTLKVYKNYVKLQKN